MAKIDMAGQERIEEDKIVLGVLDAPEIYADGYRGVMTNGQTVKVNFFSNRFDGEDHANKKVAAFTLVISIADFIAVAEAMQATIANFQRDGVINIVSQDDGDKS